MRRWFLPFRTHSCTLQPFRSAILLTPVFAMTLRNATSLTAGQPARLLNLTWAHGWRPSAPTPLQRRICMTLRLRVRSPKIVSVWILSITIPTPFLTQTVHYTARFAADEDINPLFLAEIHGVKMPTTDDWNKSEQQRTRREYRKEIGR